MGGSKDCGSGAEVMQAQVGRVRRACRNGGRDTQGKKLHADACNRYTPSGAKKRAETGWPWALAASRQRSGHSRRSSRAGAQPYAGGGGATTGPSTCDRQ